MSDQDNTNFIADPVSGVEWVYASKLIDEAFRRLRSSLTASALSGAAINVQDEGFPVGLRSILDFFGDLVQATDDGTRILITLPNWGVPGNLGNANAAGGSVAVPRADHVHKRDIRVKKATADIGTRNALNFSSAFTVTDNAGTDSVDVDISVGFASDAEFLAWLGL